MALAVGFLLFALGVVALVSWWPVVMPFFAGALVFFLLFGGLIGMIVGYSDRKAKGELEQARQDKPSTAESR